MTDLLYELEALRHLKEQKTNLENTLSNHMREAGELLSQDQSEQSSGPAGIPEAGDARRRSEVGTRIGPRERRGTAGEGPRSRRPAEVMEGGWLAAVDPARETPGLPGRTGTDTVLPAAALPRSSCLPPLKEEPMLEPSPMLVRSMLEHDAERVRNPECVQNLTVYDSMESPHDGIDYSEGQRNGSTLGDDPPGSRATLVFDSRFESGNLRKAIKVYEDEYDLILRPDINTKAHTQWFYFSVRNTRQGSKIKFNIINLMKEESLYSDGMQPLVHSAKEAVATGKGWHRKGENVAYYQNNIRRKHGRYYYTLTFSILFDHDLDEVHIAHCYPYTYTDLQQYLERLSTEASMKTRFRRRTLCQSLAGNSCELLTVTNFADASEESLSKRKGVVITARVHPGETNASWMMKGVLDFITGNSAEAWLLRSYYIFKIVPMLNPDGVINGNYRCSLAAVDLNRMWSEPSRKMHPTIFNTKMMIKKLIEDREVVLFCDLHGHSRKKDIFLYGCSKGPKDLVAACPGAAASGTIGALPGVAPRLQERAFPRMLRRNIPDVFSYAASSFSVQRSKESTARVVCWRELSLVNSFTLEASFAGASSGPNMGLHFNTGHLEAMGRALCVTLLDYAAPDAGLALAVKQELSSPGGRPAEGFSLDGAEAAVEADANEDDRPTDSDDDEEDDAPDDGSCSSSGRRAGPFPQGAASLITPSRLPENHHSSPALLESSAEGSPGPGALRGPRPAGGGCSPGSSRGSPAAAVDSADRRRGAAGRQGRKAARAMRGRELRMLSRQGDEAARRAIESVLPMLQQRHTESPQEQHGFLQESGVPGLEHAWSPSPPASGVPTGRLRDGARGERRSSTRPSPTARNPPSASRRAPD